MRVVSLVPSLTETLLECGVEVVGRTRFCVHPADQVKSVKIVGGTKQVDWSLCQAPDLVVFDREENTKEMADTCPFPWMATRVTGVEDVGRELAVLADRVESSALRTLATDWATLAGQACPPPTSRQQLPGLLSRLGPVSKGFDQPLNQRFARIEYVIWMNPWMAISAATFIGSVLRQVGLGDMLVPRSVPYPELTDQDMQRDDTFYLFSSEPFPFPRYKSRLEALGVNGALVDGEFYSWFGVRGHRLLSAYLKARQAGDKNQSTGGVTDDRS